MAWWMTSCNRLSVFDVSGSTSLFSLFFSCLLSHVDEYAVQHLLVLLLYTLLLTRSSQVKRTLSLKVWRH